jgi:hypothetical protein
MLAKPGGDEVGGLVARASRLLRVVVGLLYDDYLAERRKEMGS